MPGRATRRPSARLPSSHVIWNRSVEPSRRRKRYALQEINHCKNRCHKVKGRELLSPAGPSSATDKDFTLDVPSLLIFNYQITKLLNYQILLCVPDPLHEFRQCGFLPIHENAHAINAGTQPDQTISRGYDQRNGTSDLP